MKIDVLEQGVLLLFFFFFLFPFFFFFQFKNLCVYASALQSICGHLAVYPLWQNNSAGLIDLLIISNENDNKGQVFLWGCDFQFKS